MIINNLKIVMYDKIIENGYIKIENGKIVEVNKNDCLSSKNEEIIDGKGKIAFPGFIDLHIHGSCGIDFMDASVNDYKTIANALYKEGTTTFLATTLTSDFDSLKKVCLTVKDAIKVVPSLGGIHFEGPYINVKYKGAQNEAFIRKANIAEFNELNKLSDYNVRYITLAPENEGAMDFIKEVSKHNVTVSAGHSNATFDDIKNAIDNGLSNTTHTHNAMSGHHHRNPGVVTAAMYFDSLYTECICDTIHVCENTLKTFYKIVGPDRFIIVTDALLGKHSSVESFKLFGLDCIKKDGAAYLTSGPLAGSLLNMDQGVRNMKRITNASLIDLAKISSTNAAKCLHLSDRGMIKEGMNADIVLLDDDLNVLDVYKLGVKVY
ncbi:MAG: N-acetylglucosamine-6-phosphate deacetylase [Erysipelotrichaceae bacterium]|nr:N-acetylglucosamine-6-phosphate deacetylase [Erysipelotrichaceae bacterium]